MGRHVLYVMMAIVVLRRTRLSVRRIYFRGKHSSIYSGIFLFASVVDRRETGAAPIQSSSLYFMKKKEKKTQCRLSSLHIASRVAGGGVITHNTLLQYCNTLISLAYDYPAIKQPNEMLPVNHLTAACTCPLSCDSKGTTPIVQGRVLSSTRSRCVRLFSPGAAQPLARRHDNVNTSKTKLRLHRYVVALNFNASTARNSVFHVMPLSPPPPQRHGPL